MGEAVNLGSPTQDCSTTQVDPTMTAGENEIRLTERDVPTDDSGFATVPCSPGGVNATTGSRFFCLADECEDTLSDTELSPNVNPLDTAKRQVKSSTGQ